MLRSNAQQVKERGDWPGKEAIQDFGKPELFVHESFFAANSGPLALIGFDLHSQVPDDCHVQLIYRFADDSSHGQEQAREQTPEARGETR